MYIYFICPSALPDAETSNYDKQSMYTRPLSRRYGTGRHRVEQNWQFQKAVSYSHFDVH